MNLITDILDGGATAYDQRLAEIRVFSLSVRAIFVRLFKI